MSDPCAVRAIPIALVVPASHRSLHSLELQVAPVYIVVYIVVVFCVVLAVCRESSFATGSCYQLRSMNYSLIRNGVCDSHSSSFRTGLKSHVALCDVYVDLAENMAVVFHAVLAVCCEFEHAATSCHQFHLMGYSLVQR